MTEYLLTKPKALGSIPSTYTQKIGIDNENIPEGEVRGERERENMRASPRNR